MASFSYTLDPTGRRTQIAEEDGRTSTYTYDDLYRLIGEDIVDPVNGNHTASWTYDAVGNRLTDNTNGVATNYNYDANDHLLTQGSKSFTYDDNGSTTSESDGVTTGTFVYDSRNKLVEAMVDGALLSMSYDMDGNRIGKTVDGTPVNYVMDNNQSYAQVVVEEQSSDTLDYTFGTDLLNLDSLSGGYTYHTDALGSNRLITDSLGSFADELGYDGWGDVLAGGNLSENQYRYTGEQFDGDLDQVYLRARYLDTARGGFTQMDEWVGHSSQLISLNKYLYGNGEPANVIDPSGYIGLTTTGTSSSIFLSLATRNLGGSSIFLSLATRNLGGSSLVASSAYGAAVGIGIKLGGKIAGKIATKLVKRCIKKKDKCRLPLNMLIVGSGEAAMVERIRSAHMRNIRTISLKYERKDQKEEGWYVQSRKSGPVYMGGCGSVDMPGDKYDCDEYPMLRTNKGGKGNYPRYVSLEWVPRRENRRIGGFYGAMGKELKKKPVAKRGFVVVTSYSMPSAYFVKSRKK